MAHARHSTCQRRTSIEHQSAHVGLNASLPVSPAHFLQCKALLTSSCLEPATRCRATRCTEPCINRRKLVSPNKRHFNMAMYGSAAQQWNTANSLWAADTDRTVNAPDTPSSAEGGAQKCAKEMHPSIEAGHQRHKSRLSFSNAQPSFLLSLLSSLLSRDIGRKSPGPHVIRHVVSCFVFPADLFTVPQASLSSPNALEQGS